MKEKYPGVRHARGSEKKPRQSDKRWEDTSLLTSSAFLEGKKQSYVTHGRAHKGGYSTTSRRSKHSPRVRFKIPKAKEMELAPATLHAPPQSCTAYTMQRLPQPFLGHRQTVTISNTKTLLRCPMPLLKLVSIEKHLKGWTLVHQYYSLHWDPVLLREFWATLPSQQSREEACRESQNNLLNVNSGPE